MEIKQTIDELIDGVYQNDFTDKVMSDSWNVSYPEAHELRSELVRLINLRQKIKTGWIKDNNSYGGKKRVIYYKK